MIARFGRYEAIEELGRGGMGVVYRAVDTRIGRTVALKTVLLDEAGRRRAGKLNERLIREVNAAGNLHHPNIITIHDVGDENGAPYIVMELIQGHGLDKVLEKGTPPVEESLRILRDTARALDFAHVRGVIHRDIKPSNILIATDGTVKLVDFGIAKVAGTETITETGAVMGSVPFMAPESLQDESSAASDQFSLAAMAYLMLTGRKPFQAERIEALMMAIVQADPRPVREMNPRLPAGVDAVLARGLAKSATGRYESCTAFVDALEQACRPVAPQPSPPPSPSKQPIDEDLPRTVALPVPNRSRQLVLVGGAALVGIALAGWLVWTWPGQTTRQDKVAEIKEAEKPKLETKGGNEPPAPTNIAASEPPRSNAPVQRPKVEPKSAVVDTPSASSQPAAGAIRQNPRDGLKSVWIPPGRFRMGCSEGDTECDDDEKPARDVEVTRGFWIGQTEVTQEAYQKVKGTNPSNFKGSTLPVESVSWTDANAYCQAVGMRLPTEAEWEYAARGGSTAARYGTLENVAWYQANSGGKTHPVAQKQPNGFGLYDVLGNVYEWVADWYDEKYYGSGVGRDPGGPPSGTFRVVRGGSWKVDGDVRLSFRYWTKPYYTGHDFKFGLRCAGELRQAGAPPKPDCRYQFDLVKMGTGSAATTGRVNVNTGADCSWTASTSADWLTLVSPSGRGVGVLLFNADANNTPAARTGTITIGNSTFTITQGGVQAPVSGTVRENPRDGLKYVWIPPGRFRMGCSAGDTECSEDEKPTHEVEITRGFWIGQTEVTQQAYQKVKGTNPSEFNGSTLPVERVSWTEANGYCESVGMRLPTEAEWEYAARGGSTASRYGTLENVAWYDPNSGSKTHPVAQKQPNGFGLYDVLGNVWEWVVDWYDVKYYGRGVVRDPRGPASGQERVVRGSSWFVDPRDVRLSYRHRGELMFRSDKVGLRCAGELR